MYLSASPQTNLTLKLSETYQRFFFHEAQRSRFNDKPLVYNKRFTQIISRTSLSHLLFYLGTLRLVSATGARETVQTVTLLSESDRDSPFLWAQRGY